MKQYGLIGYPIKTSFSPDYFNQKFTAEGIDANYKLFPLASINHFPDLLQKESFSGLNVTIPYKQAIIPFLDSLSPEAAEIGAVNTIVFKNGKTIGHNTDVFGFEHLLDLINCTAKDALVFGTGGASKAVEYVLKKKSIGYQLVSRAPKQNAITYAQITTELGRKSTLWINTTPVGTFPNINQLLNLPFSNITSNHFVVDLVYNPKETAFLKEAKHRNAATIGGLEMLHKQAQKAWILWQG